MTRPHRLDDIVVVVTRELGVDFAELCGTGRRPAVVLARGIISLMARRTTLLSFPEIARGIGRPAHSTIIAAARRTEMQMASENPPTVNIGGTVLTVAELYTVLDRKVAEYAGHAESAAIGGAA